MGINFDTCYLCGSTGRFRHQNMVDHLFGVPGIWHYKSCDKCRLTWLTPRPDDVNKTYLNYYTHGNSYPEESLPNDSIQRMKTLIAAALYDYPHLLDKKKDRILGHSLSFIGPLRNIAGRHIMWIRGDKVGRLLDVGCGDGMFMAKMRQMGWEVAGVEPDPAAVEHSEKKNQLKNIYKGLLEEAEFADNSFDVITISHVIEHLANPIKTIRECRRILKPGGLLVVTTPNSNSLGERWFGENWRGWEPPRHLFLLTPESLQTITQLSGFNKFTIKTFATTAFNVWLASVKLKEKNRCRRHSQRHQSKVFIFAALGFWVAEYLLNLFSPCGEELVLFAIKQ